MVPMFQISGLNSLNSLNGVVILVMAVFKGEVDRLDLVIFNL